MTRAFGAILAGGESRRYGSPKALAPVGGVRIVDRVAAALRAVLPDLVMIANDAVLFQDIDLPVRPDVLPGQGALGGIHSALRWAREEGRPGIVAVACDMPFPSAPLLRRLADLAFSGTPSADAVVPASASRRGLEPLCAAYRVECIEAIEARIAQKDRRVIGFFDDVRIRTLPTDEVAMLCDPAVAFMNVNTPEERERAEALVARGAGSPHA